tara:strand:- start:7462 stop:8436 length:975 start_codon:yes stop_codon:yes gene_type:complete
MVGNNIQINEFKPPHQLNTAVLFLVFNRLKTTKQVFKAIRKAKPPRLYIAADGARIDQKDESKKVIEVREYISSNIDWECEVKTLFRERNHGCKLAVSEAIDWFFENEEMGIILEDDCLPSQSFFWFCEELLEKFKNDMRVWQISGNNFHFGWDRDEDYSYYFSFYGSIWGWASWKTRWNHYDLNMKSYEEIKSKKYLWDIFGNQAEADFRISNYDKIKNGLDTWDFQWTYARFINSGLSIVPKINLVKNLGFGKEATHTHFEHDRRSDMNTDNLRLPLSHQDFVIRDKKSDDKFFKEFVEFNDSFFKKSVRKLLETIIGMLKK